MEGFRPKEKKITNTFAGEAASGGVFADPVVRPAHEFSGVFRIGVEDVQRDESELVDGAESVAALQRFPVVEPLDTQTGVRLGLDAAFKVGRLAFLNGHFLHLEGKTRSFHWSVFREPLSDWTAFQVA